MPQRATHTKQNRKTNITKSSVTAQAVHIKLLNIFIKLGGQTNGF